ncbi:hypothetical protein [Mycolicibacterium sp.]|uniref:hypothetical protein n=1 Tax=Mycolicibacterium sp. TaxID=2320850 RepID=UPI0025D2A9C2|nr:hypothetical protein [Mycolicibacterium sp.]
MLDGVDMPKNNPADVIRQALDDLESGADEVLADNEIRQGMRCWPSRQAMYAGG